MRERFKETTKPRERENWPYQSNVGMGRSRVLYKLLWRPAVWVWAMVLGEINKVMEVAIFF